MVKSSIIYTVNGDWSDDTYVDYEFHAKLFAIASVKEHSTGQYKISMLHEKMWDTLVCKIM